jgi:methionyl aminopeptidase
MSIIQTPEDLQNLRHSSLILASCLDLLGRTLQPGLKASELDKLADTFIRDHGGIPSFKGYQGYPYSLCLSVNQEVVHGLPSETKIIPDRGLVSLDLGVVYKGMYSDSAVTHQVGELTARQQDLVKITKQALWKGISVLKAGARLGDIGYEVDLEAKKAGFGNVLEFGGHGLGYQIHDDPFILHAGRRGKGSRLFENQVIAIEPMFTLGSGQVNISEEDGWTVATQDGSWSAHFEHTILITKKGYEVLTDVPKENLLS